MSKVTADLLRYPTGINLMPASYLTLNAGSRHTTSRLSGSDIRSQGGL